MPSRGNRAALPCSVAAFGAGLTHRFEELTRPVHLRVRGTNTDQLEPQADPKGEDPRSGLRFYSNPIFLAVGQAN